MNIAHYVIGVPPTRNGGSVQYANDLMLEQKRQGHKVLAVACGNTLFRFGKTNIVTGRLHDNIPFFSLTNPLTPTLIYGTSDPKSQMRKVDFDRKEIRKFFDTYNISVLHLHTMMGLHKDVVQFIKSLGVKVIYSSHDFHGICPHYNLIRSDGELCDKAEPSACVLCNANEPSDFFLRLANSSLYHFLKKHKILKPKAKKVSQQNGQDSAQPRNISSVRAEEFAGLLEYYREYFKLFDLIHFNSTQTRERFEHFLGPLKGEVIPVITNGIDDRRKPLHVHNKVSLGFVGSLADYKGFPLLKEVCRELYNEGVKNLKIKVYGNLMSGIDQDCPLIEYCGTYTHNEISYVLYHLDGTLVPSKWYETFSLITLESLAHGRPAIVSDHVGAKDIVTRYSPELVFSNRTRLKEILSEIAYNPSVLEKYNAVILRESWPFSMASHAARITNFYAF